MKRDRPDATDAEPHVFDQTNGVVDLGAEQPAQAAAEDVNPERPDNRTVAGIAMWASNHF